jgi:hypothetical protein
MVLTEASKTVISISFELGNLFTDLLTTYRVVFEGLVRSPQYRVPYAVFGCLSIMVALVSHGAAPIEWRLSTTASATNAVVVGGAGTMEDPV